MCDKVSKIKCWSWDRPTERIISERGLTLYKNRQCLGSSTRQYEVTFKEVRNPNRNAKRSGCARCPDKLKCLTK